MPWHRHGGGDGQRESGSGGIAVNDDARPRIYAPGTFQSGSSISHLDESTHGSELMSPHYSGADHEPSDIEMGMLADMGWTTNSTGRGNVFR